MSFFIEITAPLTHHIPVYRGDTPFRFRWSHRIGAKHRSNLSCLNLGSHTGTHIDAPLHFFPKGASVDKIALDSLVGNCRVAAVPHVKEILAAHLPSLSGIQRILFKTENSSRRLLRRKQFAKDFTALSLSAAQVLVKSKIKLVGIDYLSIEKFGHLKPEVHWALLKAGIVIVEGLDLSEAPEGDSEIICLPLLVIGAEGAPARAVLRRK